MSFAWPKLLWLLVLPAGLLVWELLRKRRFAGTAHPKILRAEAGLTSVSLSGAADAPIALSRRLVLLCAGLAFGIAALARPQWGQLDEPVFDQSREIIIALDLSRSMTSPDVTPTRLERAKLLIQSLLDRLQGERVGLIAFSGTAFLQAPPSADYEILREFLPVLGPDYLPEGGTNYHQLLETAVDAFGEGSPADRYLVILSDGEATDEDWEDMVPKVSRLGIRVIGLGVGTAKGAMIPDGQGGYMKDENGAVVLSHLESGTLRKLANATHGAYRDASDWVDLPGLLSSTVEQGRRGRFVERSNVRLVERYQWALAQALVCLVASFCLEFPIRPKPREVRLSGAGAPSRRPRAAQAAAAAVLLALLGTVRGADAGAAPEPAATLSKIVGRLSSQRRCSALDWAELGGETVTWGQHLLSAGQPVPEGPVRDALAAVDIGQGSDARAADWARIRSELEKLLEKPKDEKSQKEQKQPQDQDQQRKQDQQQGQGQSPQQSQSQDQQQGPPPPQGQQEKPRESGQQRERPPEQGQPKSQDAFGDMKREAAPPPPEHPMQKVGGLKKDEANDPAQRLPELAIPLEKLERLRNQDSPGELFELLRRGEPIPPAANTGKNW